MIPITGICSSTGRPNSFCRSALQAFLPESRCEIVFGLDQRVLGGGPIVVIDPVENAVEVVVAVPENAFKTRAELRRLDFLHVFAADRGHRIREDDSSLQKVQLSVKLQRPAG